MAQLADVFGGKIGTFITADFLKEIVQHTVATVVMKLFPVAEGDDPLMSVKARVELTDQGGATPILKALIRAKALQSIHPEAEAEEWPKMVVEMQALEELVNGTKDVSSETLGEEAATKMLFGLHAFKEGSFLYSQLVTILNKEAAARVMEWHTDVLGGEATALGRHCSIPP